MRGKVENRKRYLKNIILIILVCIVADGLISVKIINDFQQFSVDKESLFENNEESLKDFALEEDGRLIAESDDPWVYYPLQQTSNVKTVEIDVDSVSIQDTWAELHFILGDGSWEHQSFFIHDGTNMIKVNGNKGLNNVKVIRFDFVNIKDASVKINNVIVNNVCTLTLKYHMMFLLFVLSVVIYQVLLNLQIVNQLTPKYQVEICSIKYALLEKWTFMRRPFAVLVVIYLIGISAILRANFNYIDDMGRVAEGYKEWNNFSRYVSYYLSSFIHADNYLTDVSPLPQIIAVVFLALSGVIILCVILEQRKFTKGNIIALIPLGLSPYFLECISYKYDSPYMALSILASVCPLLFYNYNLLYIVITVLGILTTCTTYQASLGVYPMLVMLICMRKWNKGESFKEVSKLLITSICGYVLGLVIFRVFIMQPVSSSYVTTSIIPLNQLLPKGLEHLFMFYSMIQSDFKSEWLGLIALMQAAFVILAVRESKQRKVISFIITSLTLLAMSFSAFGIYPFLEKTSFEPRSMYGFGILITYIGVCISFESKAFWAKVVSVALSWCFFTFAFTYGNALMVQSAYTDFRINMVINDLNDIEIFSSEKEKIVQLSGSIGFSPILKNMPQDYQMLNRLVPVTFQGSWTWGQCGFYNYYGLKNIVYDWWIGTDIQKNDLPVIQDTMYHTIKGNDDYILIELK